MCNEDAACKLAIELFKQRLLPTNGSDEGSARSRLC